MKRHYLVYALLIVGIFINVTRAQNHLPNFSGTWNFSTEDSKVYVFGRNSPEFDRVVFGNCSLELLITYNSPEFIIKKNSVCPDRNDPKKPLTKTGIVYRYFTDGRGEVNNSVDNEIIESKTEWKKNIVLITIFKVDEKSGKKKPLSYREYSISKNKEKLTEKITQAERFSFIEPSITNWVYKIKQ